MDAPVRRTPGVLDRSRQAAPQIFDTLRERILSLTLKPNTLLSRAALQAEFGVSQTPVRDALMKLEEQDLVEIYPQHATVVSRIDVGAARQAHFLRISIELEALRRVSIEHDQAFVDQLRSAIEHQKQLVAASDYPSFVIADLAMHHMFFTQAGVPDLWLLIRRHGGHIDRLRRLNLPMPGKIESVIENHVAIIDAVERRDPDGAATALRQHLSGTLSTVDRMREQYPDYFLSD